MSKLLIVDINKQKLHQNCFKLSTSHESIHYSITGPTLSVMMQLIRLFSKIETST